MICLQGCGGYAKISPVAYDYAKALYSITNRKSQDSLPKINDQIASAHELGELTDQESRWLSDIVSQADKGKWVAANRASRRMLEDQVESE